MARINMHADAKEENSGGGGNTYVPAPRGIYTLQISDHSDGKKTSMTAKNPGVAMTNFTCEISDQGPDFGKKVWHNVTWLQKGVKGHGMAVHFLHAVGMTFDGDFSFDESEFQGLSFRALLEVESYQSKKVDDGGKPYINEKNVIREIYTDTNPEPSDLPVEKIASSMVRKYGNVVTSIKDEVPF